jgi:RNA polymerase sigma-70 factor (ECF subfamily)
MPNPAATSTGNVFGAAEFITTHWSVVLAIGHAASPAATQALENLCRTYWRPLYAFVRRQGYGPEEAQDLTQGFFARLLERRDLENVRREKGRFRSYLLVSVKHFLVNEWHRNRSQKRGGAYTFLSLDELHSEECQAFEPVDTVTAEKIFERRWALTLLDRVLKRLGDEFGGDSRVFECWKQMLAGDAGPPSQAQMAAELGMTENSLKQALHRLRLRYRRLLREEVANTVAAPGDVEDELRHLIAALRT